MCTFDTLIKTAALLACAGWSFASIADETASEKLRVVRQDSVPKYGLYPSEPGLCDEIYSAIGARLAEEGVHLEVNPQRLPIQRIVALLMRGDADAYCGAGTTEKREETFTYSALPVYYTRNVLVARVNDPLQPKTLEDLAGTGEPVMAFFGTSAAARLKAVPGLMVDNGFSDVAATLKLLASKSRYRFFYYHDLGVEYLIQEHKLPLKVIYLDAPAIPQWMIYSPTLDAGIRSKVEQIIARLSEDGTLDSINKRY